MGSSREKYKIIYPSGKHEYAIELQKVLDSQDLIDVTLQQLQLADFKDNDEKAESLKVELESHASGGGALIVLEDEEIINIFNHVNCLVLLAAFQALCKNYKDKVVVVNYAVTSSDKSTNATHIMDKFNQIDWKNPHEIVQKILLMTSSRFYTTKGIIEESPSLRLTSAPLLNPDSMKRDMFQEQQKDNNSEQVIDAAGGILLPDCLPSDKTDKENKDCVELPSAPSLNTGSFREPWQEQKQNHKSEQVIGVDSFKHPEDLSHEETNKDACNNVGSGYCNDGSSDIIDLSLSSVQELSGMTTLTTKSIPSVSSLQKDVLRYDSDRKKSVTDQDATTIEPSEPTWIQPKIKLPANRPSPDTSVLPPRSPDDTLSRNDLQGKEKNGNNIPVRPREDDNFNNEETNKSVVENDKVLPLKRNVETQTIMPNPDRNASADGICSPSSHEGGDGSSASSAQELLVVDLPIDTFEYISQEMNHPVGKYYKDLAALYGWSYDRLDKFHHRTKMTGPCNHFANLLREDEFKMYTYRQFVDDMRRLPRKDILYGLKKRGYSPE